MKINRIVRLLKKGKYEKAERKLLKAADIDINEFRCKITGLNDRRALQIANTWLLDVQLFNKIYTKNKDVKAIFDLIDDGANPNRRFYVRGRDYSCHELLTDFMYDLRWGFSCIELLVNDSSRKDILLYIMKKGHDIRLGDFYERVYYAHGDEVSGYRFGANLSLANFNLANSYDLGIIDLRRSQFLFFGKVSRCTQDERKKDNSSLALEYTEKEIKEVAKAARYGIVKRLKDAQGTLDDEKLQEIEALNKQIDNDEKEYLGMLQDKAAEEREKAAKEREKAEQAKINKPKVEELIVQFSSKIESENDEEQDL